MNMKILGYVAMGLSLLVSVLTDRANEEKMKNEVAKQIEEKMNKES